MIFHDAAGDAVTIAELPEGFHALLRLVIDTADDIHGGLLIGDTAEKELRLFQRDVDASGNITCAVKIMRTHIHQDGVLLRAAPVDTFIDGQGFVK